MDYQKFLNLLKTGEQPHIDFKIKSDAFNRSEADNAELAKDICAMANNGNIASYLIIGVSNDRKNFKSVENPKLTDDELQNFCKTAISPVPKVRVYRKVWKKAASAHAGKEFVIIQIGPNPRQAYHLARDFINYDERFCLRRNEVWIRRGATSDLARPEEIGRLVSGKPLMDSDDDKQKKKARFDFLEMSENERRRSISEVTKRCLDDAGYILLKDVDNFRVNLTVTNNTIEWTSDWTNVNTWWGKSKSTVTLVHLLPCLTSLTKKAIGRLNLNYSIRSYFVFWEDLRKAIPTLTRRRVKLVKRAFLVPVVRPVPAQRIEAALPDFRKVDSLSRYYYLPHLKHRDYRDKKTEIPSSSELIVLQDIKSLPEYEDNLASVIKVIEEEKSTVVSPV